MLDLNLKRNILILSDCREALKKIPSKSINLIYLDHQFNSKRNYTAADTITGQISSFGDIWKGGVETFISFLRPIYLELHRVLADDGSIIIHCDPSANYRIRMLADEVFGSNNFRNEIVWCYYSPSNPNIMHFPEKHDTIFWYVKSNIYTFNKDDIRIPYHDYTKSIKGNKWNKGWKEDHTYDQNPKGKLPEDFWLDIGQAFRGKEHNDYPTQKPIKLLDRIIKAFTKPGDIVLDPFCGSGTSLISAYRNDRFFIGIDISPSAINLSKVRIDLEPIHILSNVKYKDPEIIKESYSDEYIQNMKPIDFQDFIVIKMNGIPSKKKSGDKGIDGRIVENDGHIAIQAKKQFSVGRPVVDEFLTAIKRDNAKSGIIVAFSFSKDAYGEVERIKNIEKISIDLQLVDNVIKITKAPKIELVPKDNIIACLNTGENEIISCCWILKNEIERKILLYDCLYENEGSKKSKDFLNIDVAKCKFKCHKNTIICEAVDRYGEIARSRIEIEVDNICKDEEKIDKIEEIKDNKILKV